MSLAQFLSITISRTQIFHKDSVAIMLRCGGIFSKKNFTANLLLSLPAKEFWLRFYVVTAISLPFFSGTQCTTV